MKVLAFGSRDYCNGLIVSNRLDQVHSNMGITELIEGEANGADKLAAAWAVKNNIKVTRCPANWDKEGKSAGMKRNMDMALLQPQMAVGFFNGASKGSINMAIICMGKGIPLYAIDHHNRLLRLPKNVLQLMEFLANKVDVGRSSQWGNPYKVGYVCPRCGVLHAVPGSTLACYEAWVTEQLIRDPHWLDLLQGATLFCPGCPTGSPTCHARVLKKMILETCHFA